MKASKAKKLATQSPIKSILKEIKESAKQGYYYTSTELKSEDIPKLIELGYTVEQISINGKFTGVYTIGWDKE